jgi:hypothetical protein
MMYSVRRDELVRLRPHREVLTDPPPAVVHHRVATLVDLHAVAVRQARSQITDEVLGQQGASVSASPPCKAAYRA